MATDEPITFGRVLSRYRSVAGLTQEELAERAGLSVRAISDLERGVNKSPRAYTAHQLADALQLSLDDRALFEGAARTASDVPRHAHMLPEGNFLGALPIGQLVAREDEIERLSAFLDAVAGGAGHLVLLGGEAGTGTTRLLQELMVQARVSGALVLTARCDRAEVSNPYYPVLEALAPMPTAAPKKVQAEVLRVWKRMRDMVARVRSDTGADHSDVLARQQLFRTISDLLILASRSVPLVLLLDDLEWADQDSLKLLQYLAHTARGSRVLIAATFHDGQLTEDHPHLAQMLQTLSRERLVERIMVRRLSLDETTALVAATMGSPGVSEEFGSFVYRRTKGSPRLIDGMIRSLGGRLELQGEIGAGSMGRVFRAFDRTTHRTVAAKLVLARAEIDLDILLRFQQEGAVLATLKHPHIVDIYDTFAEEHASCIIMELLDGRSLGHILRNGALPLGRARGMSLQVAEALAYAHDQGIVHRDIKPDNVMVLEGDQTKVTDFGIARILQPDTSLHTIATTGMRMGTPLYMAPEQIEGKGLDGRTDIYALGAMLFHMVTGYPPFEGTDALAVAVKHLQEEPRSPSSINPAIPASWDALILKAMAKDPVQRFQRAEEIKEAIVALPTGKAPETSLVPRGPGASATSIGALSPAGVIWAAMWKGRSAVVRGGEAATGVLLGIAILLWLFLSPPWAAMRAHRFIRGPIAVWGLKLPHSFHFKDPIILGSPVGSDLYVGDYVHGAVLRLSTHTGLVVAAWGSKGTGPGQFRAVNDLAVDGHGTVYVADEFTDQITVFSAQGKLLRRFGHRGVNPGQFYHPSALAIDGEGNVFVADSYNDRIQKVSPTGKPLLVWGSAGRAPGQVFGPNAIKLDADGNIWVSEHANRRIQKFSPSGKSLGIFMRAGKGPGELTDPQGLAIDRAGNIYALDEQLERVQKISPTGTLLATWGATSNHREFKDISTISIDNQNRVYIADPGNDRIHILSTSGKLLANWNVHTLLRRLFQQPTDAASDSRGNAYVSDSGRNAIEKLSPAGDLLLQWGRRGSRPGQFSHPSGIGLDAAGNVYVADTGNGRIQEFTSGGTFIAQWRTKIPAARRQGHPTGLAIDRLGNIYVTDSVSNLVQGFSGSHQLFVRWGRSDHNHPFYRLKAPSGLAMDRQGNIYVADTGNHRVLEYLPSSFKPAAVHVGKPFHSWGGTPGTGAGQFLKPTGVAVDSHGNVYVVDAATSHVQAFTAGGTLITAWGTHGSDPGGFEQPSGISLDATGNIYVADTGNSRVQKFRPIG